MMDATSKARVLAEALPWIKRFAGQTVVIKYGGNAMTDAGFMRRFVADVVLLHHMGVHPVVVHGAGPQISEMLRRLNHEPTFVEGYRLTGEAELDVVRMILQKTNKELVSMINQHGDYAVGVSGEDANLIRARTMRSPSGADLGFVGEVERVDTRVLDTLVGEGFIPVVAPMGCNADGQAHNVNADHAAAALAAALGASKLVFLTDIEGLRRVADDESTLIRRIDTAELAAVAASGAVGEGMIPKVRGCIDAINGGVESAHMLDGRLEHALLLEIFTDEGVGTMITAAP